MDTPIISPWLFYIAGIADGIDVLALVCGIFSCAWLFICAIENENYGSKEHKLWKPIIAIISCIIIAFVTPSSDTLYKMTVAKMLTPNNINTITEYADSLANDTTNMIESVMDYGIDRIYDIHNNQKAGSIDE